MFGLSKEERIAIGMYEKSSKQIQDLKSIFESCDKLHDDLQLFDNPTGFFIISKVYLICTYMYLLVPMLGNRKTDKVVRKYTQLLYEQVRATQLPIGKELLEQQIANTWGILTFAPYPTPEAQMNYTASNYVLAMLYNPEAVHRNNEKEASLKELMGTVSEFFKNIFYTTLEGLQ